jgi:hypothetical protein
MEEIKFERRVPKKDKMEKQVEEVKETVKETKTKSNDIGIELASCLFHKRTQFHIWHLQTKSYPEHKLFNEFYDSLLGLADSILEQYQGKYGRIYGVCSYEFEDYSNADKIDKYLEDFCYEVKDWKQKLDMDSNLNNLFDEVIGLICSTRYLLTLN